MTLKHLILFFIFTASCFWTAAQNLVPNPSFENTVSLPCVGGVAVNQFNSYFQDWNLPTLATSDFFSLNVPNTCSIYCLNSPWNHLPKSGNNMVGAYCSSIYNDSNSREYIQTQLLQTLTPGQHYYAKFHVSLAAKSRFASNNLGMYFSDTLINSFQSDVLNFTPQIIEQKIITDSVNWVKISGTFTASSPSQYIILGCFSNGQNTSLTPTNHNDIVFNEYSYYFFDDILVKETCLTHSPDTTICQNTSATLNVNSNSFIGWAESTNPSTILSTSNNFTVSPQQSTNYLIYSQCDTFDIWVYVQEPFTFNIGNDTTLCPDETLTLSPQYKGNSYLWSNGSTDSTITVNSAGLYSLEITKNGCSSSDNIMIDYYPEQIFSFDQDTAIFCPGDTLNFLYNLNNANYLWSDNSTSNSISITQTQNLSLAVEQNGCTYEDSILIYTPPGPQVNLGTDTSICEDLSIVLNAHHPYSTFLWQDGSTEAELIVNEAGTYWVNVENCFEASDTILIETENCDCVLYLPNTFTPNQNGVNDEISAVASCPLDQFEFIIYNRWGKVVFHSNNIQDFWNGTVKNQLTNTTCFSYSLQYSFADDAFVHTKYGHINMLY